MGAGLTRSLAKLAGFGLTPIQSEGRGTTVAGTYAGRECGYHWGPTAAMSSAVRTRGQEPAG